jgi:serine/threonine-protein kinase
MKSARSVDHRADIWALGVILFELLAGQPPFAGDTLPELIANIMMDAPLNLRQHRPDVPAELEAVIVKCLQKDRDQRYQSVAELAHALAPFATRDAAFTLERISKIAGVGTRGSSLPPPPPANAPVMAGTATNWSETNKSGQTQTPPEKKSPSLAVMAAALALIGAVGGAGAWWALSSRADLEPDRALTEPVEKERGDSLAAAPKGPDKAKSDQGGQIVPVVSAEQAAAESPEPKASDSDGPKTGKTNQANAAPKLKAASHDAPTKAASAPAPEPAAEKTVKKGAQPASDKAADKAAAPKTPQKKNPLAIELK